MIAYMITRTWCFRMDIEGFGGAEGVISIDSSARRYYPLASPTIIFSHEKFLAIVSHDNSKSMTGINISGSKCDFSYLFRLNPKYLQIRLIFLLEIWINFDDICLMIVNIFTWLEILIYTCYSSIQFFYYLIEYCQELSIIIIDN